MLRGFTNQEIIEKIPYLDMDSEDNSFYRDFLVFLKYVDENKPKLTQTKNLNLKSLTEINNLLIRKKPMEEKVGDYIFRVRSEDEMRYIRTLDALAEVMRLAKRFKGRLRIKKGVKKFFDSLPPRAKLYSIWNGFIHYLNWAYLQWTENGSKIAQILQDNQEFIWLLLRDFDFESKQGWISLNHTLETIRKEFRIDWQTVYGDKPDLACSGIRWVIFTNLLEVLDLVQVDPSEKEFKLTDLGRKIIRFQVSENEVGLPIEANFRIKKNEQFKIPIWMDCTWRRISCEKDDCPICGRIKKDRQKHIERGEGPDSMESVFEDVGHNLKEILVMVKKDAERFGIDITNIDDIKEPPEPEEFPLYEEIKKWSGEVLKIGNEAELSGSWWVYTEAAVNLFWYSRTLQAKTYRQLCNRWHIENGDDYGKFDHRYTKYVLEESLQILKNSLLELVNNNFSQKERLNSVYSNLLKLEKDILKI